MKYLAILKAFDKILCGEWHSGSCTYYKSKSGLDNEEDAQEFLDNMQYDSYKNDTARYKFERVVLSYKEEIDEQVEKFFKYM